ncbi:hypothetical protein BLNAU_18439 [Blattamonas nauphoetae]|uniref:Uncharacterized protein n=1 Tax=Blattamonas nauphoetae TaxID=2049346 RepID=A0ABQ9X4S7_9EUKA|nr:hypothetical protein BLNAU_18439 [Blattamonas nauphoetae]
MNIDKRDDLIPLQKQESNPSQTSLSAFTNPNPFSHPFLLFRSSTAGLPTSTTLPLSNTTISDRLDFDLISAILDNLLAIPDGPHPKPAKLDRGKDGQGRAGDILEQSF